MTLVCELAGLLFALAATLTSYRVLAGPSTLDRVVGIDSLLGMAMGVLAVWAAATQDTSVVPGISALSLVSFLGSAAVTRFRVPDEK